MNWEMIGAVGEILGAAAVIATLAYLSRQIRASTQATRRAAMQEIHDQSGYFLDHLSSTSETAGVCYRGMAGDASLSPDQRVQFRVIAYRFTLLNERLHYMAEAGDLEPWFIERNRRVSRDIVSSPGYQAWFRDRGAHLISDSFRTVVEQEILAPPISLDSRLAKTAGPERKGRDGPEAEGEQGDRRS